MKDDKKTQCETEKVEEDGKIVIKEKKKYGTFSRAQDVCDHFNMMPNTREMLTPYKCRVCHEYHTGRNGKRITNKYKDKLHEKLFKKKKTINLRIVGKIDLSKVPITNKELRKRAKEKIEKEKNKD